MNHDHDTESSQADLLPGVKGKNRSESYSIERGGGITDEQRAKKKKIIKWAVIIGILVIAVILAIVLPLTLKSSSDDTVPSGYNPYVADPKSVQD